MKLKPSSKANEDIKIWFWIQSYHRMNETFSIWALKKLLQSMQFIVVLIVGSEENNHKCIEKETNNEFFFYCMMAFITCHFSSWKMKVWSFSDDWYRRETKFWSVQGLWMEPWAWKIACKYYEYVLVRFFTRPNLHFCTPFQLSIRPHT